MDITVAGPGAGKTTNLVKRIMSECYGGYKLIFVITFTNSAKSIINTELSKLATAPVRGVLVSTIHSFLLSEIIFPYHHFLYDYRLNRAVSRVLPSDPRLRQMQLSDMHKFGFIDNSEVFSFAKYIICGKSSDKKSHQLLRKRILKILSSYISDIFIDEAQDIDQDIVKIVEVLDKYGIQVHLIGDPKQDIRASKAFQKLIHKEVENVKFVSENFRCPQNHVAFMNLFVEQEETQVSMSEVSGELEYIYADVADISKVMQEPWDLKYIVEKNDEFNTLKTQSKSNPLFDTLADTIKELVVEEWEKETFKVYNYLKSQSNSNPPEVISLLQRRYNKRLSKTQQARIKNLQSSGSKGRVNPASPSYTVLSIDSAKGEEGERCLFIFTTDFINYLKNPTIEMNKTKSRFYVALSRSKKNLTFLFDKKVVEMTRKEEIKTLLEPHGFKDVTSNYM